MLLLCYHMGKPEGAGQHIPTNRMLQFTNSSIAPTQLNNGVSGAPLAPDSITSGTHASSPIAQFGLVLQDVNILIVTDVHSWVAGRSEHDPYLDADYGDVLSFLAHL